MTIPAVYKGKSVVVLGWRKQERPMKNAPLPTLPGYLSFSFVPLVDTLLKTTTVFLADSFSMPCPPSTQIQTPQMMLSQPEPSIFPNAAAMLDSLVMCCASKE
jgi:hypothetical protein